MFSKLNKKTLIIYLLVIISIGFSSCKTEEDKYPNMAVFDPNMKGDFVFEEIESIAKYYRDTDKYVFFSTTVSMPQEKVDIYHKESKKLIKSLPLVLVSYLNHIDSNGVIYGFDENTEEAFKYTPPKFEKVYLDKISLRKLDRNNLEKKYAVEIKAEQLEGKKLNEFFEEKQYEILKKEIIDSLVCITDFHISDKAIAHFKNKEIYLEHSNYLHRGIFIKSKLKGVEDCDNFSSSNLDESAYFDKNPLTLIDQVTLDYYLTGGNHYAIGLDSKDLYYYNFVLSDKSIKFKSPYLIKNVVNLEGKVILESGSRYYKVSLSEI